MDDLRPNEMAWRFEHESDADARTVIGSNHPFASAGAAKARSLLQEVIEDWADNERGAWDADGETFNVVVLAPKNMAGKWKVHIHAAPCVIADREGQREAEAAENTIPY